MEYFISDMHLNQKNCTDEGKNYDKRPFKSVKEMNEILISNWNKVVTKNDHVFVLGDMSYKGGEDTIRAVRKLNGHIHLIAGNHDRYHNPNYMKLFSEIVPYKEIKVELDGELKQVILSHFPIMFYNGMHRGSILLYGHVHNTIEEKLFQQFCRQLNKIGSQQPVEIQCQTYNVGCMMPYMDFTPKTLKEIIECNTIEKANLKELNNDSQALLPSLS